MFSQNPPLWEQEKIKLLTGVGNRWLAPSSFSLGPPPPERVIEGILSHEGDSGAREAEGWPGVLSLA